MKASQSTFQKIFGICGIMSRKNNNIYKMRREPSVRGAFCINMLPQYYAFGVTA